MGITYGDYLIDSGYYDITPEQEREIEAREECARLGIDPDDIVADGGATAWMVVDQELRMRPLPLPKRELKPQKLRCGGCGHVWWSLDFLDDYCSNCNPAEAQP
jgi:hypothetical protein